MEACHGQRQLHRDGVPVQEPLDRDVVGFAAELAPDDAGDLAIMDGWVELLQIEDVAGHDVRVALLAFVRGRAAVDQAEHAAFEEAACFFAHGLTVQPGSAAALRDADISQHDVADDLVIVLHRVGEAQSQLMEILWHRHSVAGAPPHAHGRACALIACALIACALIACALMR
jgi:hypothetical protein